MNISATVGILILTVFLSLSAPAYAEAVPSYPHTVVGCANYPDGTPAADGELVTLHKLGDPSNKTTALVGAGFDKPGWWKANLNDIPGGVSDGDTIVITVIGVSTTLVVDTSMGGQWVSDTSPMMSVAADPTSITENTATDVTFTVTSDGSPVDGALVTLSGCGADTSGTTIADGTVMISVTATDAGDIAVNVAKAGYVDATATVTVVGGLATSPMSVAADPTSITENTATDVTFTVTSDGSPVDGALVTLLGCGADTSGTTGPDGIATISVTATEADTIDVTATMDGYADATTTVTVTESVSSSSSRRGSRGSGTYPPEWDATPTPTAIPTATPTPTAASEPTADTTEATTVATTEAPTKDSTVAQTEMETTEFKTESTPGFGAVSTVFVIAGLLATYLVMRRRE